MRLYAGCDLHSSNTYLGIIDEDGKRVFKKKLSNDREVILNTLAPYKDNIVGIVVESTYNWYWLVDILTEEGYKVHFANTTKIQKFSGLKYADDQHDAFWLAEMLEAWYSPGGIYLSERRSSDSRFTEEAKPFSTTSDIADFKSSEHSQP